MNGVTWTDEEFTASDGYRWRYRRYAPPQPPRANVVCLHGIQSHAGWYEGSCYRLAAEGYAVSFLNRRGSGNNQTARGDMPSWRRLVQDVAEFLTPLRSSKLPLILLGISWGGKIALALAARHPGLIDGLALLCPGFCPLVGPSFLQSLAILWGRIREPARLIPIPLNDPELFTTTPRWLEFLDNDQLGLRQATARLLIESARLDGYLRFWVRNLRIPVLLQLAGRDRVIDNARTRQFASRFLNRQIHEYSGAHHTLEFEPDTRPFLDDLVRWLGTVSLIDQRLTGDKA